ncbi:hypothetical protein [Archangium primigenium]|uniref:hypothetical protein n=1 Tax=[Archangium] primigenium TaxID=2792470 RepID=UPI001EF7A1C9|nr:hypothetical protein [Archangium primigenium]
MSTWMKKLSGAARPALVLLSATACVMGLGACGSARHSHGMDERQGMPALVKEPPPPPASDVPVPARPQEKAFGARYATPEQCEVAARALLPTARDQAWASLRSCVERTHFTHLKSLLSDAWAEELRVRPDAARLIAQVVAKRGGSVPGELALLHERRVPIFALSDAIAQPDIYKGRYLLLRAQVADVRSDEKQPTVWLVEQSLGSVAREQSVGVTSRRDWKSGQLGGPASGGGALSAWDSETYATTVPRYDNLSDETGREALGRLPGVDPFFAPGKDFVVLARFDGLRATSSGDEAEEDAPRLPVLSIVSYFPPHPLVVY